jgi:hypothetical protein
LCTSPISASASRTTYATAPHKWGHSLDRISWRPARPSARQPGLGGADTARGSGLTGLSDRIAALGGTIALASPLATGRRSRCSFRRHP